MAYASYFAELVDKFTLERLGPRAFSPPGGGIYYALCTHVQPEVVARWGELRLMTYTGLCPPSG